MRNSACYLVNMVLQTAVLSGFQHHVAVNLRHVTFQFNSWPLQIRCYPPLANHIHIYFHPTTPAHWHQPIIYYQHLPPQQLPNPHFTQPSSNLVLFQLFPFCPAFNSLSLRSLCYPPPTEKPVSPDWERKNKGNLALKHLSRFLALKTSPNEHLLPLLKAKQKF